MKIFVNYTLIKLGKIQIKRLSEKEGKKKKEGVSSPTLPPDLSFLTQHTQTPPPHLPASCCKHPSIPSTDISSPQDQGVV